MRADNKAVILGEKINVHNMRPFAEGGDNDGDAGEPEPGRDVTFSGMTLTKKQFEELVGEGAFESFFNQTKNAPLEPAFTSFKKIKLDGKYRNCYAKFVLGHTNSKEIEVNGATFKGLALTFPKVCNERACAELAGTVQAIFPRSTATLEMENFAGKEVRMSLRLGTADEVDEEEDKQQDFVKQAKGAEENDAATGKTVDKTRVLAPGQAEREADAQRQLGETLRGLEKGDDKKNRQADAERIARELSTAR